MGYFFQVDFDGFYAAFTSITAINNRFFRARIVWWIVKYEVAIIQEFCVFIANKCACISVNVCISPFKFKTNFFQARKSFGKVDFFCLF
jgi:hypothetical protein